MSQKPATGKRIKSLESKAPVRPLIDITSSLGIHDWDLLLVGDGSGSKPDQPFGWASCLIERVSGGRQMFYGALNCGTINLAELLPYILPLDWYNRHIAEFRPTPNGFRRVHVLTDSDTVANWINRINSGEGMPKLFKPLMFALLAFRELGYSLVAHWIPRESILLNSAMDLLSVSSRIEFTRGLADSISRAGAVMSGVDVNHLEPYVPAK